MSDPSLTELEALADHASRRVSHYRRRVYVGTGDPRHLAELERVAEGALARVRHARRVPGGRPAER